jgi:cysteine desulfurase
MKRAYFDHAATTPVHPEVLSAMLPTFSEKFGNPSSLHALGQEAAQAVANAREQVAQLLNANPREIIFTGSGTEADNFALKGIARKLRSKGNHLITSSIEHHAVLNSAASLEQDGYQVTYLPVDSFGRVDPEILRQAITPGTILVSIMFANNEVGTIEPIAELAAIAHEKGILFHTDAVQATGSIPLDVKALGIDMLTLAAHKFYGPKGVGALYVRQGVALEPLICGGGQERGLRAGTTNVSGIVGLGKAAELARLEMPARTEHALKLRERLIKGLERHLEEYILTGHRTERLPGNVSICVEYIEGESMLLLVDQEGFACSSGSACTSGSLEPSHVLKAMGINVRLAQGSLRITLGRENTALEVDRFLEVLPGVVNRLREMSPFKRK